MKHKITQSTLVLASIPEENFLKEGPYQNTKASVSDRQALSPHHPAKAIRISEVSGHIILMTVTGYITRLEPTVYLITTQFLAASTSIRVIRPGMIP